MSRTVHFLVVFAAGALLGAGLVLVRGASAGREARVAPAAAPVTAAPSLVDEVAERLRSDYVDGLASGQLDRAAVDGMVASLDPHSAFLDPAEYDAMRVSTAGHYSGEIGRAHV